MRFRVFLLRQRNLNFEKKLFITETVRFSEVVNNYCARLVFAFSKNFVAVLEKLLSAVLLLLLLLLLVLRAVLIVVWEEIFGVEAPGPSQVCGKRIQRFCQVRFFLPFHK